MTKTVIDIIKIVLCLGGVAIQLTKEQDFSFFSYRISFYSLFPGTIVLVVGGFPFQQEDNASWKCHVRAAVHWPGNVGWMMTGQEHVRGDDSRSTKLDGASKHLDSYFCCLYCTVSMKNSHFMALRCQFCIDEGSYCGFWWNYLQDKDR